MRNKEYQGQVERWKQMACESTCLISLDVKSWKTKTRISISGNWFQRHTFGRGMKEAPPLVKKHKPFFFLYLLFHVLIPYFMSWSTPTPMSSYVP